MRVKTEGHGCGCFLWGYWDVEGWQGTSLSLSQAGSIDSGTKCWAHMDMGEQPVGVSPRINSGQKLIQALQGSYTWFLFSWTQEVGGRPFPQHLPHTVCYGHIGLMDIKTRNAPILPSTDIHFVIYWWKQRKHLSVRHLKSYFVPYLASSESPQSTHTHNWGQRW